MKITIKKNQKEFDRTFQSLDYTAVFVLYDAPDTYLIKLYDSAHDNAYNLTTHDTEHVEAYDSCRLVKSELIIMDEK